MNRAILSKRISSLLAEVSRLSNALCAMNTIDLQRYPENYELLSTDAALRAEQIACRMRHLVYGFTTVQKHEYLTSAVSESSLTRLFETFGKTAVNPASDSGALCFFGWASWA